MASNTQERSTSPWLVIAGVVLLVILAWAFFAARGAGAQAAANEAMLVVADLDTAYVAGGPERFPESFDAAMEDAEDTEVAVDDLRWATLIVGNTGLASADDVTATLALGSELEPVYLADLASFGSLSPEAEGGTVELDLADIGEAERSIVFLGFDPQNLPSEIAGSWAGNFDRTVSRIDVAAGEVTDVFYGGAL